MPLQDSTLLTLDQIEGALRGKQLVFLVGAPRSGTIADVSSGRQITSETPNYQEVQFGELVCDGPSVVKRLLAGIGVRSTPEQCQRYVNECNIEFLRAGNLADARFDVAAMNKESFRLGTTDSWHTELSKYEIALVEHMAGPLMSEFGFKPMNRSRIMSALLNLDRTFKDVRRATKWRLQALAEQL
jgi:hypothetical protein